MNLPELNKTVAPERHWECILVNCEYLPREVLPGASKAAGQPIGQVFVIVDLNGFRQVIFHPINNALTRSDQSPSVLERSNSR